MIGDKILIFRIAQNERSEFNFGPSPIDEFASFILKNISVGFWAGADEVGLSVGIVLVRVFHGLPSGFHGYLPVGD